MRWNPVICVHCSMLEEVLNLRRWQITPKSLQSRTTVSGIAFSSSSLHGMVARRVLKKWEFRGDADKVMVGLLINFKTSVSSFDLKFGFEFFFKSFLFPCLGTHRSATMSQGEKYMGSE